MGFNNKGSLLPAYKAVREASVSMCQPLAASDYWRQLYAHASPPGWNLVHTSWMFAQLLRKHGGRFTDQDEKYGHFANSYYSQLGDRIAQDERGSKVWLPVEEVYAYRADVDARVTGFGLSLQDEAWREFSTDICLGMQHEQQHQELFFVEEKERRHQRPRWYGGRAYRNDPGCQPVSLPSALSWVVVTDIQVSATIGNVEGGFGWDNEFGVHNRFIEPFAMADRLVSCGEYLQFMQDKGYKREELWLSNGWKAVVANKWKAPAYWKRTHGQWYVYTLDGYKLLDVHEPVCHVSFYEAEAFARWKALQEGQWSGARLSTEFEWEYAARSRAQMEVSDGFLGNNSLHPFAATDGGEFQHMYGQVWQWTTSHYEAYPYFKPYEGFLSEYNGKFMDISRVLRGGSCVNEKSHLRPSYRNFWSPDTRWQMTGIRLAKSL